MGDYMNLWEELKQATIDAKNNPILIVPIFLQALVSIVVAALFFLLGVFFVMSAADKPFSLGISLKVVAMQPSSWAIGGIVFFFFFIVMFLLNSFFSTGLFAMVREASLGKTSWSTFSRGVKLFFKKFLAYNILYFIIIILALIPAGVGVFLLFSIPILGILLLLFGVAFFFLLALLLWVSLFFVPPIMFTHNLDAVTSMKESWFFFTKNLGYTLATLGITLLVSMGASMILGMILFPFNLLASQGLVLMIIAQVLNILRVIVQMLVGIVLIVFMFRVYNALTPKKAPVKTKKHRA